MAAIWGRDTGRGDEGQAPLAQDRSSASTRRVWRNGGCGSGMGAGSATRNLIAG